MKISQIYSLVNDFTQEYIGDSDLLTADMTNVVDFGTNQLDNTSLDKYVNKLVDHIGKVVFDNRIYNGFAPSVLMESWEFGAVKEKIFMLDLPEAKVNDTWNLVDQQHYPYDQFFQPNVGATFWDKRTTFEIDLSTPRMQAKSAFDNAGQLASFISGIYNWVERSFTVKMDSLIMRLLGTMIAKTVRADFANSTAYSTTSTNRCINLLKLYNDRFTETLTAEKAITDPEFIRFAAFQMGLQIDRMSVLNSLFNIEGRNKFTNRSDLHVILLSDFIESANVYLQSDTFHETLTRLPKSEKVPFWQGNGQNFDFNSISSIRIKHGNDITHFSGILGIAFDHEALGVSNLERWVNSTFNPRADFYTNFWKTNVGYFGDTGEQFVIWYVADSTTDDNNDDSLPEVEGA